MRNRSVLEYASATFVGLWTATLLVYVLSAVGLGHLLWLSVVFEFIRRFWYILLPLFLIGLVMELIEWLRRRRAARRRDLTGQL